jgi:hypothetical protein
MGMSVHDAVAMEFEAVLLSVVGQYTKKRLKVLRRPEQRLPCIATKDDVIDGGRGG